MPPPIRVMIVDDSALVCRALSVALERAGFVVVTRTNPIGTGGAIVREKPDLVLLDVSMPALQGDEIVASLVASGKRRTKILLHSDRTESELTELTRSCGADGFVRKGMPTDALTTRIKEVVRSGATRAERRVLVVEPEDALRERMCAALSDSAKVTSSDSGTEALMSVASVHPPDMIVVSTELVDLPTVKLAREAIRVDATFKSRFILVRGPQGSVLPPLEGFDPPLLERAGAVTGLREIFARLARST